MTYTDSSMSTPTESRDRALMYAVLRIADEIADKLPASEWSAHLRDVAEKLGETSGQRIRDRSGTAGTPAGRPCTSFFSADGRCAYPDSCQSRSGCTETRAVANDDLCNCNNGFACRAAVHDGPDGWPLPSPDPRGDGLCPNCPTDLATTAAGHGVCVECGWTSDPAMCQKLYDQIDELTAKVRTVRAGTEETPDV